MKRVAVIAHRGKTLGGGLPELRRVLGERGVDRRLLARGRQEQVRSRRGRRRRSTRKVRADLRVGRRRHGAALHRRRSPAPRRRVAIIPAGTANLLATNLGIPKDIEAAVDIGLSGNARRIDVGRLNGERFAVMAGAGFDARMIGDADGGLKDRVGRLAYVWTGAKHLREKPFRAKIEVDGARWFDGEASCILLGNVGKLFGGVEAFEDAQPGRRRARARRRHGRRLREWAGHDRPRRRGHGEQVAARRSRRRRAPCASSSTARCRTSSTAATARRCASCASRCEPEAVTICVPA